MDERFILSSEQQCAYDAILKGNNLIITGNAGTGKSYIIKKIKQDNLKKAIYLSYTGLASVNIGGSTINSQFCLKPTNVYDPVQTVNFILETMQGKNNNNPGRYYNLQKLLNSIDLIIFDEISMIRIDLWKTMDLICRNLVYEKNPDGSYVTDENNIPVKSNKFFGGIQIVAFGDFFQLPPIPPQTKPKTDNPELIKLHKEQLNWYYSNFKSHYVFTDLDTINNMKVFSLKEIHRQSDYEFINALNIIRTGDSVNLQRALDFLNTRVLPVPEGKQVMVISSHNDPVDKYNLKKMQELPGKSYTFEAITEGNYPNTSFVTKLYLKEGAQVMLLTNDSNGEYVNGTMGIFKGVTPNSELKITLSNGSEILLPRVTLYNNYFYFNDDSSISLRSAGSISQYPIKPAWATTVHKSQGQTFDAISLLDFNPFNHGQTYVALSRVKSLDGLYLSKPLTIKDVKVDQLVKSSIPQ